jgi:hypothetical protein
MAKTYEGYDFCGWATRNDLRCKDGRTIRRDAFAHQDGAKVPLVWGHNHDTAEAVIGHGYLENRPEGVFVYGYLNDNDMAKAAKNDINHGDITSLSIWANELVQKGGDVLHGAIKEVSLVLAGANLGAQITYPIIAHGDNFEEAIDEAFIYCGEEFPIIKGGDTLKHSDSLKEELTAEKEGEKKMADTRTPQEFLNSLSEDDLKMVAFITGQAIEAARKETSKDEIEHSEGGDNMNFNAFEGPVNQKGAYLSHADEEAIISDAKKYGSFKQALEAFADANSLAHDSLQPASGFDSYPDPAGTGVDMLFPEWHDVRPGAPELVTDDLAWVKTVLGKVHKSPFSRIRTGQVDIRSIDALRAKGYKKGTVKALVGNYALVRRTTDPQTIYVKSALNRDDIVDITDFDYVAYQYKIDRGQLEEELATAILIGDGREAEADYKIEEAHIRPIWTDDDLFTIHVDLAPYLADINGDYSDNFGDNYKYSEAMVAAILDAMIDYRGSGNGTMFCTQQFFNKMMLAKDLNGRRIYNNKNELATALGVGAVVPVSKLANKTRTKGTGQTAKTMKLDAIIVNLGDYSLGSTKGGEITHFTQFDIDFNQEKSLLETRVSGALTRIYSAIVIEEENP